MQVDILYYGTYAMARSAGLSPEVARTIAYSSQFVNDYTTTTQVQFDDGASLYVGPTALNPVDFRVLQQGYAYITWVTFNFLPGNKGNGMEERLVCQMNSPLVLEMVTHHINETHQSCYLQLVGIAAHVYASTFAHYGFSGIISELNAIDGDSIAFADLESNSEIKQYINSKYDSFKAKFGESVVPPIGHGGAATFPDRPYLNWSFRYKNSGNTVERSNPQTFLDACKGLHKLFMQVGQIQPELTQGDPRDFTEIQETVSSILAVQDKINGRISAWQQSAELLFAGQTESIPPYDADEWKKTLEELTGSMDSGAAFELDSVLFCEAAAIHRKFVLNELIPHHGIEITTILPESEMPQELLQEHISRPGRQVPLLVPSVTVDDPFAHTLDEPSSIDHEAKAFAALAAAKGLTPPLSIGVFGRWGAGKSFFMARMHKFVKQLSGQDDKGQWFHNNIVQIRFNAWHYMETNLWASLVQHIFSELDRWLIANSPKDQNEDLLGRLVTARTQELKALAVLAEKRRNFNKAQDAFEKVQDEHQESSEAIAKLAPSAIVNAFWSTLKNSLPTEEDKERLENAFDILGYSELQDRAEDLQALSAELGSRVGQMRLMWRELWPRLLKSRALVIALIILVILIIGLPYFRDWLVKVEGLGWTSKIKDMVLWLAATLGTASVLLKRVSGPLSRAVSILGNFRSEINEAVKKVKVAPSETIQQLKNDEAIQRVEMVKAENMKDEAESEKKNAEAAYKDSTARKRLNQFIHDKLQGADYAKHLGIISSIRRDFGQMAALMSDVKDDEAAQEAYRGALEDYRKEVELFLASDIAEELTEEERSKLESSKLDQPQEAPPFRRIILYIDDLDRCPSDKVVDVLQAIHLLLYFRLFVVVVAVDARWVSRALRDQYPNLLDEKIMISGDSENSHLQHERGSASSLDYMEKIFQIPYWVQPMSDNATKELTKELIDKARKSAMVEGPEMTPEKVPPDGTSPKDLPPSDKPPIPDNKDSSPEDEGTTKTAPERKLSPIKIEKLSVSNLAKQLTIDEEEERLLQMFSPFVGRTPRRVLRFVNTYRVLNTCQPTVKRKGQERMIDQKLKTRALICQLAIVTGAPQLAHKLADYLLEKRNTRVGLTGLLKALRDDHSVANTEGWDIAEASLAMLETINKKDKINIGSELIKALADQCETTIRYGFVDHRHEPKHEGGISQSTK